VPKELGQFDIVVVGSLLLHLQDPWGALRSVASIAQDKLIVTEKLPRKLLPLRFLSQSFFGKLDLPCMVFLPDAKRKVPVDAWWFLAPGAIKRMLAVLGFGHAKVTFHSQPYQGEKIQMFTVVAKRAAPLPSLQ